MTNKRKPLLDRLDPGILEKVRLRQMTLLQAAKHFDVTATHLSRVLKEQGFEQEPSIITNYRREAKEKQASRITKREALGRAVAAGKVTLEDASESADCSLRTMWRYVAQAKLETAAKRSK